jgi:hypothetical protein
MKSVHPIYSLQSVPVLPVLPSKREVREGRGFPILTGLPEVRSWRDAIPVT